jgi:hypothetical protein
LLVAGTAGAADVAWSNASGSNADFAWSNGKSGEGMWGNPVVTTLGFWFTAMKPTFKAEATYPASNTLVSTCSVLVNTINPKLISELHIREYGTYSGDIADVIATSGTLTVSLITPYGGVQNLGNLTVSFNPANHTWTAFKDVNLAALNPAGGKDTFNITVTNYLQATPDGVGATTAIIQKTGGRFIVPEPATLALALVGFAMLSLRRSR